VSGRRSLTQLKPAVGKAERAAVNCAKSMAALGSAVERTGLALGGPFSSIAGWYFLSDLIRCLLIGGRG